MQPPSLFRAGSGSLKHLMAICSKEFPILVPGPGLPSSQGVRTVFFLVPEPGWPLRSAAAADPEAGAACRHRAALGWGRSTNGEGQGEGSFEIIYKHITKFHYFCLPTAAHKSTKVHESRARPSASAQAGARPSIQGIKNTQGWDGFQGQRDAQARVGFLGP